MKPNVVTRQGARHLPYIGGQVEQQDAERILEALSRLTGETYSFNTVQVTLAHNVSHLPNNTLHRASSNNLVPPTIRKGKFFS